jgi:flavin-dependent dehydrogenase
MRERRPLLGIGDRIVIDVLVAGGGPVGLATAIEVATRGATVAVAEPRTGPIDKACGEGLMPGAVRRLAALGVHPHGVPFHGIRYVDGPRAAQARFRTGSGVGVRRTTLHAALSARADELGVRRMPRRVDSITEQDDGIEAAGQRARWLVAADGLHSPVRRLLGLDRPVRRLRRYGLRRHFAVAPWSDLVEVHWSPHAEAYVTPVAPDLVGIAFLCADARPYDAWLGEFPALRERLAGAQAATSVRGAGPLWQRARRQRCGRVLFVGDAAGYVDALTGEGIATGLACASAAAQCLADGRPEDYPRMWRRATRTYRLLTGTLVQAAAVPAVRSRLVPAAARLPWVFDLAIDLISDGPDCRRAG